MEWRERVFEVIDRRWEEFLDFGSELIQIPSVNPPGDYEVLAPFVVDKLRGEGLDVEIVQTPDDLVAKAGLEGRRLSVLAKLPGTGGGPEIALVPHLDTVPVGEESNWSHPPLGGEISDGRLWGRGACDCKGRLACFALIIAALKEAGVPLRGDVVLAATPDEEIGGKTGAGYLSDAGILAPKYAIMEGYINRLFYGNGGQLVFIVEVTGKATHCSTPWLGISATEKLHKLLTAVWELQDELREEVSAIPELRHSTINVGVLQGGTKSNVIPDRARAEIDIRFIAEQTTDGLLARIQEKFDRVVQADSDITYSMTVKTKEDPYVTPKDSPLLDIACKAVESVGGEPPELLQSRGGSDSRFLIRKGTHTIALGPGHKPESGIHEPNENIRLDHFVLAAKATALAVMELNDVR